MMALAVDDVLEPSGLGHDLLVEWGQRVRDDRDGRASWSSNPRIDPGYHGDLPERIRLVDKIIAKHRLKFRDDWRVVSRFYLNDLRPWQIAMGLSWSESRVRTRLVAFCGLIEREYRDFRGMS